MQQTKLSNSTPPQPTTAWVDLISPSHPFLFRSIVAGIDNADFTVSVRKKTETVDLATSNGFEFDVLGRDFDNPLLRKAGIPLRTAQLAFRGPDADVSLSARNAMCVLASKARGIPSIHFTDNDITAYVPGLYAEQLYNFFEAMATHIVVPEAFETDVFRQWGATSDQIHTYDGYKEDIYIADFEPDPAVLSQLPFEEYIVVRPEALDAAYVSADTSLVPDILERAVAEGLGVVYLPRGRKDERYADGYSQKQVYTPDKPLDGRQLAWYSYGVLTGSGTMAREAACMDKPAVSFFPDELLSVDRRQIEAGMLFHSRDVGEIFTYLNSFSDPEPDRSRSKQTQEEVLELVSTLIAESV